MIVAACASHCEAEPDGGSGVYAIDYVFDGVLFGDDAAFAVAAVVAIEAGGDLLIERCAGKQVAGDLLDGESVKGHVAIEGVDDPIAPPPHGTLGVCLVAVGVGIARGIQPADGHALAVSWGGEQAVHHLFVSLRGGVFDEFADFG